MRIKIIFLAISLLLQVKGFSQGTTVAKTVFEMYDLPEGGCPLKAYQEGAEELYEAVELEGAIGFGKKENQHNDLAKIMEKTASLFQKESKFEKLHDDSKMRTIALSEKFYAFWEAGKWGIKNEQDQVVIKAKFDDVWSTENETGFLAYQGLSCNHYDFDGERLLAKDYLFILPTRLETYIVQTKKGYGILKKDGTYLVEPSYYKIEIVQNDTRFYYRVYLSEQRNFLLAEDGTTKVWLNSFHKDLEFLGTHHLKLNGQIVNTKTNRKFICGAKRPWLQIVHPDLNLAVIKSTSKNRSCLIDLDGNILNPTLFKSIGNFSKQGTGPVFLADTAAMKNGKRYATICGIMNSKGKWTTPPKYKYLLHLGEECFYAQNQNDLYGIIDANDNVLVAFEYKTITPVFEKNMVLCVKEVEGKINSILFQPSTRTIIKKDLPYNYVNTTTVCGRRYILAKTDQGMFLMNDDFEPISKRPCNRIRNGQNAKNLECIAKDQSINFMDCEGALKTFKVGDKEIDQFKSVLMMSEQFKHVSLINGEAYFILPDGTTKAENSSWHLGAYANFKDFYAVRKYGSFGAGMVNSEGVFVLPPVFDFVGSFDLKTGLARYTLNPNQKGYLTTTGKLLFGTNYQVTKLLGLGLFKVMQAEKWGIVNRQGKIILPCQYDAENLLLNGGILYAGTKQYLIDGTELK